MRKAMKKVLRIAMAVLLLAALSMTYLVFAEETEHKCYIHGDINQDGRLTDKDAIYTLYHSFGLPSYPATQDADFTGDQVVNDKDAVYLLYASYDLPQYPMKGTVHDYYEPVWTWNADGETVTATVSVKCPCGEPIPEQAVVTKKATTAATCTTPGSVVY